jgi:lipopolysaccharide/colanic/teichoic acid biosynthesis glycosyltransferase
MSSLPSPPTVEKLAPAELEASPAPALLYQVGKRIFDVILSGFLLVLLAPVWLVLAALIKLDSMGPVFYVQSVVGRNGTEFLMYKFRSMLPNSRGEDHTADLERNFLSGEPTAADEIGPIYKTALTDQSRITRVGRFLRRTSLDELPQVWNVFRGDMSLVGPRPALPEEARMYSEAQRARFRVRPGITGLYQVTGRNRVPIEEMIRMDLEYIGQQSMWLDFKILLKTPLAMLSGM